MGQSKTEKPGVTTRVLKESQFDRLNGGMLAKKQFRRNREYEKQFPILRGFMCGNSVLLFCPYCGKFHTHGWDPKNGANVAVLRYSHCSERNGAPRSYRISPFRQRHLQCLENTIKGILGLDIPLTQLAKASKRRKRAMDMDNAREERQSLSRTCAALVAGTGGLTPQAYAEELVAGQNDSEEVGS